jgi:hypothetical protein
MKKKKEENHYVYHLDSSRKVTHNNLKRINKNEQKAFVSTMLIVRIELAFSGPFCFLFLSIYFNYLFQFCYLFCYLYVTYS